MAWPLTLSNVSPVQPVFMMAVTATLFLPVVACSGAAIAGCVPTASAAAAGTAPSVQEYRTFFMITDLPMIADQASVFRALGDVVNARPGIPGLGSVTSPCGAHRELDSRRRVRLMEPVGPGRDRGRGGVVVEERSSGGPDAN